MTRSNGILSLYIAVFFFSQIGAQEIPVFDDFEGNGTIITWAGDNCGMDIAFPNPVVDAINPSATVLRYDDYGGQYANVRFDVPANFDLSENHRFTIKIYVPSDAVTGNQPNQISLKLQDGHLAQPWITQTEIIKPITTDQWQLVYFDFGSDPYINLDPNSPNPLIRRDFNRVLLQVNGENNNDKVVAYIDDVSYNGTVGSDPDPNDPVYDRLVWSDEFEGPQGPIDTSKWHHQTLLPNGYSWYNNELQHYTDRTENSYVADGLLHIVARRETFSDQGHTKDYTSARLNSKFAFTYGKVEVRAKLPTGAGTWPAIWMLGKNISEPGGYWFDQFGTVPWPACGEIDIMEHWGVNQNYFSSALHTPCSHGGTVNVGGLYVGDVSDSFHIYSMEWFPDRIAFRLDGQPYYTYYPPELNACYWPFDADQYLLLNVAMVGAVDPAFTHSPMVIDYVRVYQETVTSTISTQEAKMMFEVYPNPSSGRFHLTLDPSVNKGLISITDLTGKVRHRTSFRDNPIIVNQPELEPGLYFVTLRTEDGLYTQKVVIR